MLQFCDAVNWLCDLLRCPSVESEAEENMPFGRGVNDCLLKALRLMNTLGFSTKNCEGYCGYGEVGEGELFGILCHLDVVPEGEGWSVPPYGGQTVDGKLFGRGTLDDKGPFVACLYAAAKLLETKKPTKRLRFILGCDEESGWKCMEKYLATEEIPASGFSPDADFPVINCEKGIVYHTLTLPLPEGVEITAGLRPNMVPDKAEATVPAEKSSLLPYGKKDGDKIRISAFGKAAHGSHPEKGENALVKLLSILGAEYNELKTLADIFGCSDGSTVGLNLSDDKSGDLSWNLGTARTDNGNFIMELDIRYPVSFNRDFVTDKLKKLPCEVEQGFYHDPLYVPEDNPLVKKLIAAYDKVTGEHARPISIGGGTYARALPLGVAFGPCFGDAPIHEVDEYISLEHFRTLIDIYTEAIDSLCFR